VVVIVIPLTIPIKTHAVAFEIPIPGRRALLSQSQLDAISDRCRTPHQWLLRYGDKIRINPDRAAEYKKIDCVLAELKRANAGPTGFIGYESER